ncbi:hypothetical protein AB0F88_41935 [Streptosporangium sp. NPDC023963]|uniref:hypothetical protein n=1 Tax=Streptosporangium sp. NPDC023963 TaxID=3155608 RepID=UPI003448F980
MDLETQENQSSWFLPFHYCPLGYPRREENRMDGGTSYARTFTLLVHREGF